MKLSAKLAADRLARDDSPGAAELLPRLDAAATQTNELCGDLLECCRRRASGPLGAASLAMLDVVDVVRECVADHAGLLEKARCAVTVDAPDAIFLRSHRRFLERVLSNLIRNAAHYGAGGIIEIHVQARRLETLIVVRDHGTGIPGEELDGLFAAYGSSPCPGGRFERFGLGLWIVQNLVQSLGGYVSVATETGEGTAVSILLPDTAAGVTDIRPATPGQTERGSAPPPGDAPPAEASIP
jgi:signal transduction histidine kinase